MIAFKRMISVYQGVYQLESIKYQGYIKQGLQDLINIQIQKRVLRGLGVKQQVVASEDSNPLL